MFFQETELLSRDAMVLELFKPIEDLFKLPGVTEIAINRPYEAFTEAGASWQRHELPLLNYRQCYAMAQTVASFVEQNIDQSMPILGATLPGGQRIHMLVPPAVEPETVSFTIRIPDVITRTMEAYQSQGFFSRFLWAHRSLKDERTRLLKEVDRRLMTYLENNDILGFFKLAVLAKKNIAVVGDTGSGKTTFMKTLCTLIPPSERLTTIEDVRELFLPHQNTVHTLYSKGMQGTADISPSDLIASNMRMKPDRVLLAELRGGEAFDFLKLLTTGHSGSITSYHAESCALAYDRYVFMCKENSQAVSFDAPALKHLITLTVDIIVHIEVEKHYDDNGEPIRKERYVSEISFDPLSKLRARFGDSVVHAAS